MLATVLVGGAVPAGMVGGAGVEWCPLNVALCAVACCAATRGSNVVEPHAWAEPVAASAQPSYTYQSPEPSEQP